MIDNTHASGPASGYVPPQPKGTEGVSALSMTQEEWEELCALKKAINEYPAAVHYEQMQRFSELMVKSLEGKGDLTNGVPPKQVAQPLPTGLA